MTKLVTSRVLNTKHMNEKDLHRNLPSFRDIRTLFLHCSLVTPNQQLKQSFQTFAALLLDETAQQTSLIQTTDKMKFQSTQIVQE